MTTTKPATRSQLRATVNYQRKQLKTLADMVDKLLTHLERQGIENADMTDAHLLLADHGYIADRAA